MISIIIPSYRNPDFLNLCLKSAIDQQFYKNEIIVILDGFLDESLHIYNKYKDKVKFISFEENRGMQSSLNIGVMNASNEILLIVNDDNVFCKDFDLSVLKDTREDNVVSLNQIERNESIFNFVTKDFGSNAKNFQYEEFIKFENSIKSNIITDDGGIFPFSIYKKNYMIVGGFDEMYQSPFICDWDFFLKLDLNKIKFIRSHNSHLYHFGSTATKNGNESIKFKESEYGAINLFKYKWGINPELYKNNSHNPKNNLIIKGIKFN